MRKSITTNGKVVATNPLVSFFIDLLISVEVRLQTEIIAAYTQPLHLASHIYKRESGNYDEGKVPLSGV